MNTERRTTVLAAAFGASAVLALTMAVPASAGPISTDPSSFQTKQVSPDGFSVRTSENISPDGFAVRSQNPISQDGWAVASVELARPALVQDGWAVASVELPRPALALDGWAAGHSTGMTPAFGVDGWSYAAVSGEVPASSASTEAATRPVSSTPSLELTGLAAVLAAAAISGVMFEIYRKRAHLPI